ncbi:ABC transporter ATP-binding protein [Ramlibacter sp. PS3R-8]|uniref:ABC transporter ATP-binding protein n=1 Tax=Ramlibacter sp. PS3R-8 TaxID=3133437 RepID=UPI00309CBFE3
MLEARELHAAYGRIPVLYGISLAAAPDRFLGIIGRNGVGKTTTLRSIVGLMPLTAGDVRLDGQSIAGRQTHEIARMGVAYVPENRGVFPSLTVLESLTLAARAPTRSGDIWTLERVFDVFPRLAERRANRGDQLSGGEQQMLAIGRALLTNPRLLILDEPTEGLAPLIVLQIRKVLRSLRGSGLTIVIVDQNLETVFDIADHVVLISRGSVVAQGPSATIAGDQSLLNQYLGV